MQFKIKLALALATIILLIITVFTIQFTFLNQEANTIGKNYTLNETFSAQDFFYGPQTWVPYAYKLPVMPGVDINGPDGFYIMLVDLNATSNLNATFPSVRVDYSFTGLIGTAAFHIYGYIKTNQGISWTNRVEGDGASGYYIITPTSSEMQIINSQPMPDSNHIYLRVSNKAGATFNGNGNNTYLMKFEKAGGGLNTLHITTDPRTPNGNITTTSNSTGTFFVNFTGDRVQDNFVLLVAIKGTIGDDFKLNIKSSVPD